MIRPFTVLAMLLAGGAGLYLYQAKHNAQMLERDIGRTVKATKAARERVGMLRTEWALLNDPERLQGLADQHLTIKPLRPDQYVQFSDLEKRLPPVTIRPQTSAGTDEDEGGPEDLPLAAKPAPAPAMAAQASPALAAAAAASRPALSAPMTIPAPVTVASLPAKPAIPAAPAVPAQQTATAKSQPAQSGQAPTAPAVAAQNPIPQPPMAQPARETQTALAAARPMPAPVPLTPPQRPAPTLAAAAPPPAQRPAAQTPSYPQSAYPQPGYAQAGTYQPAYRQPVAYVPPPPSTPAEAIARIARGGPVDTSIPAVASALGAARSMNLAPPVPVSAASAASWR